MARYLHVLDRVTAPIFQAIFAERLAQLDKWGVQRHPSGTGGPTASKVAALLKGMCQAAPDTAEGDTWALILAEEVGEAFDETDWAKLRVELIQCAAVIAAWIESGDALQG